MSNSAAKKYNKSSKQSKSSSKVKPNIKLLCKFRGKYDLNKKKNNQEISLENALTLFEVIHKKNEALFKDTTVKMFKDKKLFIFGDRKGISKIHHRVRYTEVNKFFVLNEDPTMIIMGVNHKTYKWFLVFQFNTVEDLNSFCDEIEGEKKPKNDFPDHSHMRSIDGESRKGSEANAIEKISISPEMFHKKEMEYLSFEENFYEPDLNVNTLERESASMFSSRPSSRISDGSESDSGIHCDDLSRSKLKDLYIKSGNVIYTDDLENEEITCLNYPYNDDQGEKSTGSIYMYCAKFKSRYRNRNLSDDFEGQKSTSKDKHHSSSEQFNHHEPKYFEDDYEGYNHFEPKILDSDSRTVNGYGSSERGKDYRESFNHFEPKIIINGSDHYDHRDSILSNNSLDHNHVNMKLGANSRGSFEYQQRYVK